MRRFRLRKARNQERLYIRKDLDANDLLRDLAGAFNVASPLLLTLPHVDFSRAILPNRRKDFGPSRFWLGWCDPVSLTSGTQFNTGLSSVITHPDRVPDNTWQPT